MKHLKTRKLAFQERERLSALSELDILDTPPEREFDEVTRLAAVALGVQSAAISLIDETRQWFKARQGIPFAETSREIAFCSHAVEAGKLLVVPDANLDPRFKSNPLVLQENGIRFYAGMPLITTSKHCLGTLCVFDPKPRAGLTSQQLAVLQDLSRLATDLIESRRFRRMGEIAARVVAATSDAVIAANRHGEIVYWNSAAEKMFGRTKEDALGKGVEIVAPLARARRNRALYAQAAARAAMRLRGASIELLAARADGSEFPVDMSLARWGEVENEHGFVAIFRDISARKILEREREQAKAFLDTVVTNLPAMLFVKDVEKRHYVMLNKAGEKAIGRPAEEIIGSTDRELFPDVGRNYEQRDTAAIAAAKPQTYESVFRRDDGQPVHLRTTRILIDGPDRPSQYILGVSEDVTQMRQVEADILRLAHYDGLTGLLNRESYKNRLERLTGLKVPFALLSVDLDRFKAVNDQFGHLVGDAVLVEVADRLRALVGPSDWIARIGGDEFAVVLLGGRLAQRSNEISSDIVTKLSEAIVTERAVAYIGGSVGVVLAPEDGETVEQIRENADLALYRAKHEGRGAACFFNAEMDAELRDHRKLEAELRQAISSGEITLAYQPVVALATGRVTSLEALARWTHPDRGSIPPNIFIPLSEECGLIDQLGEYLLRTACTTAIDWPEEIRLAVNLSPLQFLSGNLFRMVQEVLAETGFSSRRLLLEVTEGLVIRDVERTFAQLEQLRSLEIQILIDDFGVGYSSLSYFQRFPFDKVKIDKSFIDEMAVSRAARAVIQAVIGLGEELEMAVVAEGVETEEQMRMLRHFGCTHIQGYFLSRPLPPGEVFKFVQEADFNSVLSE